MQPITWRMFRKLQNAQNLMKNQDQTHISSNLTQNFKEQEFTKLPQTNPSKHKSGFIDHIFEVRF
jgi:hypothetical protein